MGLPLDRWIDVQTSEQFCPELTLQIATQFSKSISFVKPVGGVHPSDASATGDSGQGTASSASV